MYTPNVYTWGFTIFDQRLEQDEAVGGVCVCVRALNVSVCFRVRLPFLCVFMYCVHQCPLGTHAEPHYWLCLGTWSCGNFTCVRLLVLQSLAERNSYSPLF